MKFSFVKKNNQKKSKLALKNSKGFTLIEVMVAVSIFVIVVTVGIGSLMTVNKGYRQSQAQRAVIDNVSFALETMAREIRIGRQYSCGNAVLSHESLQTQNCSTFSFMSFDINADGEINTEDEITYNLNTDNVIEVRVGNSSPEALTSADNVSIEHLSFDLVETGQQPYVVIRVGAEARAGSQGSAVVMQTSVSQRLLQMVIGS